MLPETLQGSERRLDDLKKTLKRRLIDSNSVIVRTWLDLHRIYLTNTQTDQPPNIIPPVALAEQSFDDPAAPGSF